MRSSLVEKLRNEEDGSDLVEYALILLFLVLSAVAMLSAAGQSIANLLGGGINTFSHAVSPSAGSP